MAPARLVVVALVAWAGFAAGDLAHAETRDNFNIVAERGELGITEFQPFPSINDNGYVAFVGESNNGDGQSADNIYVFFPDTETLKQLMNSIFMYPNEGANQLTGGTQSIFGEVQINNGNQVLAHRRLNAVVQVGFPFGQILTAPLTYFETWDADALNPPGLPSFQVAMGLPAGASAPLWFFLNPATAGVYPSPIDFDSPYEALFPPSTINKLGQLNFAAIVRGEGNNRISSNITGDLIGRGPIGSLSVYPMLADDSLYVFTTNDGRIFLEPWDLSSGFQILAGPGNGFTNVGKAGISDDGNAVAFVGTQDGVTGVYLILKRNGVFAAPSLISDNLPGSNFSGFDFESRVGANHRFDPLMSNLNVVFLATDGENRKGLYVSWIDPDTDPPTVIDTTLMLQEGDRIRGLAGTVQDLRLHDSANNHGQLSFWVKTSSTSAIIGGEAAGVQVLDYNDPELRGDLVSVDPPTPELVRLADFGERRVGFAADGVTPLLLRSRSFPDAGCLRITVKDEFDSVDPKDVGVLRDALDETLFGNPLDVPIRDIPGRDERRAFALLTSPTDFVREGRESVDEPRGFNDPRILKIETDYLPTCNNDPQPKVTQSLQLHRPPVLLLHGLFDKAASWSWSFATDARFHVYPHNYRSTHDVFFLENIRLGVPREAVRTPIEWMRGRKIATTQVDAFGHSMGGILLRLYAMDAVAGQRTWYRRVDNFREGDIHKLVTVDTPHFGSQVSQMLVELDNTLVSPATEALKNIFKNSRGVNVCQFPPSGGPERTLGGAVRDLRPDSQMIRAMNATPVDRPVRVHAIFGDTDVDEGGSEHCYAERTRNVLSWCGMTPSQLFSGANDSVVSVRSQRSGLPGSGNGVTPEPVFRVQGDEALHWPMIGEFGDGPAALHAVTLLNARLEGGSFAEGYPVVTPSEPDAPECQFSPIDGLLDFCDDIPLSGIIPGEPIFVTLCRLVPQVNLASATGAELVEAIVFSSTGEVLLDNAPPFEFSVTVPISAVGPFSIQAFARDADGNVFGTPVGTTSVVPDAALTGIKIDPFELDFVNYRPTKAVQVHGDYEDGITRDLSSPLTGTIYMTADPSTASVTVDGDVTAHRVGVTTLTAQNDVLTDTITLTVRSVAGDWNSDGERDETDAIAFSRCLSGPIINPGYEPPLADCGDAFDFDRDGAVDCFDWSIFLAGWTGTPDGPSAGSTPVCIRGDLNGDGSVDLDDLARLVACMQGPDHAGSVGCGLARLDDDADIDLVDFGEFQRAYGGN